MICTTFTIGYGDIYPTSFIARSAVLIILVSLFAVIGENITKLAVLWREEN